ncbi:DUF3097 family protein [Cumulibacter manganitolerans]|uniref:DUF3097 family protein n=1 Tax=Cumulibacter manganitolerans TaxID=1884992 RepID=UPI001296204C|nr:DUF3097 family protein [Cumulibacter manganitolerans]
MRSHSYSRDITAKKAITAPLSVPVEIDLVLEDRVSGFCGAVIEFGKETVTLEDRDGKRRVFPLKHSGFMLEGASVMLRRPQAPSAPAAPRTASGSRAEPRSRAKVAQAGRIYVEGVHDAALVEKIWGADLRAEGIVVEPLHGVDDLAAVVAEFAPTPRRRLGVLVDHLVPGSKESRIVAAVRDPNVLVLGHPYVDIWQTVKPHIVGIDAWPVIPKGRPWKQGVCEALGVPEEYLLWKRILGAVTSYKDVETPLISSIERLIDFIFETGDAHLAR